MAGTRGDQPRIRVWPVSTTRLRPLRNSSIRRSTPLAIRPIRLPAMMMPDTVTSRPISRAGQAVSFAMVPVSRTRSSDCQNDCARSLWFSPPTPEILNMVRMAAATSTMMRVTTASQVMTAIGPRDNCMSKR